MQVEVYTVHTLNGTSYRYRIDGRISAELYHNAASAAYDGRRPQLVNADGRLIPKSILKA
jgi:hypothetical protein